jgi:predicted component of type VI protein secretion system
MSEKRLLGLLQRKRGYFEALLDLAEEEASLDFSDWMSILEQKKILLSCIEDIDTELEPFRASFQILSHEMQEELDSMRSLVKQLLFLDTQNQKERKHLLQKDGYEGS